MKEKTVYVLGAGFSKDANAPSQEEIVSKIFLYYKSNPEIFEESKTIRLREVLSETYNILEEL